MNAEREPMLEMKNISKSFGGLRALMDVGLTLYSGEILAIVRDNGAGKSTLIKVLTGVHQADQGHINYVHFRGKIVVGFYYARNCECLDVSK